MRTYKEKIGDLIPYERNAKKHDERQIQNVMESIRQFGLVQPVVIDKDNVVIIGHCRLIAAKRLKMREIDVVKADTLTQEQVDKLRLLDNKLNESEWDMDLLLQDIPELDFSEFDIDWGLPEEEEKIDVVEVETPDVPDDPVSKVGEVYQLGRHRLIIGDSTDREVIKRLMDGASADLLLTDPPYNVGLGQHIRPSELKQLHRRTDGLVIDNDQFDTQDGFADFLTKALGNAMAFLKAGGAFYVWYAGNQSLPVFEAAKRCKMEVRQQLIWNKNVFAFGRQDYQWKHEPCIYGWKDGASHYFTESRTEATVIPDGEEIDPKKMKKEELVALVEKFLSDSVPTTIINENKPSRSEEHPTMKPLALMGRLIKNSSRIDESVLDLFGGSGSTLLACEQLSRTCYMCELDPHYADVIIQRWENFTGRKAEKISE